MKVHDVDSILRQVRSRGGRVTAVTRRILQLALEDPDEHLRGTDFVERLDAREPTTTSTVYRSLNRLVAYGVLERIQLGAGPVTYHLRQDQHEHAVCDRCGQVVDVPGGLLDGVARQLYSEHDFVLRVGQASLVGVCSACRDAAQP